MQTDNLYRFFVWYVITCQLTTYRASCFSAIIFHNYLHYCGIFLARFNLLTLRACWLVRSLCKISQLNKSRCRYKWDVTTEFLTRAVVVKQWTALHVSARLIFLADMCSFRWQKCGLRPKLFLRLNIFSTFKGVYTPIFTYVPDIGIGLQEKPANFLWGKTWMSWPPVTFDLWRNLV